MPHPGSGPPSLQRPFTGMCCSRWLGEPGLAFMGFLFWTCFCTCVCTPYTLPSSRGGPHVQEPFLLCLPLDTRASGRVSRGEESESCPLPLPRCPPPPEAWHAQGHNPTGVSGTLVGRERVLNQNRQGLPKAGSAQPGGLWDGV